MRFADHVIVATGYRVDLRRLPFLDEAVLPGIRCLEHAPLLSANFETSIPGLYFLGLASANSFGPMMRFAYDADYTARKIARHVAQTWKDGKTALPGLVLPGSRVPRKAQL